MTAEIHDAEAMTPQELAEARQYRRLRVAVTVSDIILDLGLPGGGRILAGPADGPLACPLGLAVAAGHAAAGGAVLDRRRIEWAVSLPLAFTSGYLLEHRFHLSTLSLPGWLWRQVKQASLGAVLGLAIFVGLYWIIWTTGAWWWLAAAAAFFLVSVSGNWPRC